MKRIFFAVIFTSLLATVILCNIPIKYESKILTLEDIKHKIYTNLKNQGAVQAIEGKEGKFKITDINKAKSQNSMLLY